MAEDIKEIITKYSNLLVSNDRHIGQFYFLQSSSPLSSSSPSPPPSSSSSSSSPLSLSLLPSSPLSSSPLSSSPLSASASASSSSSSSITKIINTLNLGYIQFFDLPFADNVPLGYEDDESNVYNDRKLVLNNLSLLYKNKENYSKSIHITNIEIYPNYDNSKLTIYDKDEDNDDIIGNEINSNESFKFNLKFIFKYKKEAAFIGRWIILTITSHSKLDPLTTITSKLHIGLKISGTLISENIKRKLNVEAKPFVPMLTLEYFNDVLPIFLVTPILLNEKLGVIPPENWSKICHLLRLNANFPIGYYLSDIPPIIISEYNHILLSNNLQNIKVLFDKYITDEKFDKNSKYIESLRICSWMEEIQTFKDIGQHDDISIKIDFKPAYFDNLPGGYALLQSTIKKNGSNESRPKIVAGDFIRIRPTVKSLNQSCFTFQFKGFELLGNVTSYNLKSEEYKVLFILPNFIAIPPYNKDQMNSYCLSLSELEYNIRYVSDSLNFVLQRRALDKCRIDSMIQSLIFPKSSLKVEIKNKIELKLNTDVDFNDEQKYAIETICLLSENSNYRCTSDNEDQENVPIFIVYGPPGTGKTSTICEAMRNIIQTYGISKKILACAPSDAAADVICSRLSNFLDPSQLLRINYWKRQSDAVPIKLRRYCYSKDNTDLFDIPSIDILSSFNVIVTTCATAGALDLIGITFDVVIVDEASQSNEIDCLIPITLTKEKSLVVLAGDPQQLRANNRSPAFDLLSNNESLQERLLKCEIYNQVLDRAKRKSFSSLFLNKAKSIIDDESGNISLGIFLTKNYRSHKTIFELSSRMFYHSSLQEKGNKESICRFLEFEWLPKDKEFGCMFIGVSGNHQHELDSPSFYNISELSKIVETCKTLLTSTKIKCSTKDIGIICAFRSQILKLRLLLRAEGLGAINVGDVTDFQGQETSIIIISTVLSSKVNQYEINNSIGLIGCHRKFNVSITRGTSLCICIGNPYLLVTDPNWNEYMDYCDQNSSYLGVRLQRSQDDIVISTLLGSNANDSKNSTISYYSDMPFYSMM